VMNPSPKLDVDGDYGPNTTEAVRRFQQANGLPPTGMADAATRRALGFTEPEVSVDVDVEVSQEAPRENDRLGEVKDRIGSLMRPRREGLERAAQQLDRAEWMLEQAESAKLESVRATLVQSAVKQAEGALESAAEWSGRNNNLAGIDKLNLRTLRDYIPIAAATLYASLGDEATDADLAEVIRPIDGLIQFERDLTAQRKAVLERIEQAKAAETDQPEAIPATKSRRSTAS